MIATTVRDLCEHVGEEITLRGWLYNKRSSGKIQFLIVRDATGLVQAVMVKKEVDPEYWENAARLTQESSLCISGIVRQDDRAPGGYELTVTKLEPVHIAETDYPISLKEHGVDFLLEHRHLWLRVPKQAAIMRVRARIIKAIRDYLDNNGFTLMDTPIFTPTSAEETTTLFETDYFGDKAYLTQSGQLYNEANIYSLGKVYCFGPCFRAEKSKTRKHLNEFWMVEPEMAFIRQDENMRIQEDLVIYIVEQVLTHCRPDLDLLGRDLSKLKSISAPFPRLTYDEVIERLKSEGFEIEWGDDFGAPHETRIGEWFDRPVFVTHFPADMKAFYMQPDPDRPEVVLAADLIAPEGYGEIIGGSERIHDYDLLKQRLEQFGLPVEDYQWYLDLRRYGSVPHSGFGLGIERVVAWICGLQHIREAIPFPRTLTRIYP